MSNGKFDAQSHNQMVETTLDLLEAVAEDETISQRGLAERLGVALGLTNAVLKRCAKKGMLKIKQVPAKRYAYYLTPHGFAEKSRLTAEYLSHSLQFYRTARHEYDEAFRYCATRGWRRVVLIGATELAEIASLATAGTDVQIVGILDPGRNVAAFCNIPVFQSLESVPSPNRPNAAIVTDMTNPQLAFDKLTALMPDDRVLAPKFMRLTRPSGEK
ncbi:MAG TPA: MarR family transcriptional regulator [Rhodospirillaceae bacterium]|nr:MarR family transcriptional regulator [Rhodospirillaceae bacterium]|tara:strand:+ start:13560 stop:14207 length:648 start_codon:yes stop_codon:yes gene_type:complete